MKVNHIVFAFVLSIVFSSFSHAATYYVRTDGHDTNCNGSADASSASTPNCAFLTVQKGLDVGTSPGDVINIKGDHSAEGIITTKGHGCVSDCSESPTYITIQTTTGDDDYSGIISPGIRVYHNYIVVQNLGIAGSAGGGDNNVLNVNSTTGSCMWSNALTYGAFPADPTAMNLVSNCGKGVRIYTE